MCSEWAFLKISRFQAGYTFTIRDKFFRVIAVFWARYPTIRDRFFFAEGLCSPEELEAFFEEIGYSTFQKDLYCCMIFESAGDLDGL